jgi:hypothetical protein
MTLGVFIAHAKWEPTNVGLIISSTDTQWEPLNLAHCYPTFCPGDLQLDLAPTYVSSPLLPFAKAAVDIHITSSFSSQSVGDSSYMVVHITKHITREILWPICQCCKHFCLCEMVIALSTQ